jgi:hypothetical protein
MADGSCSPCGIYLCLQLPPAGQCALFNNVLDEHHLLLARLADSVMPLVLAGITGGDAAECTQDEAVSLTFVARMCEGARRPGCNFIQLQHQMHDYLRLLRKCAACLLTCCRT